MKNLFSKYSSIPVSFGGAAISGEGGGYGFGNITEDDAVKLLHDSYEMGIGVFDTAPIYGFGLSEKRMGVAFKNIREKVFIVSKPGVSWHPNKRVNVSNDPEVTQKMLEQSLRDLKSDYIDLYMIHWPDKKVDIRRPMEVLAKAKLQGKIKHIGLCNTNLNDLKAAAEVDEIEMVQSELSLFQREQFDNLSDYMRENKIGFMGWGTLDKGIITGRVDQNRTYDKCDARSGAPWWKPAENLKKIEKIKKIKSLLDNHGHSCLELAIGYNLSKDGVDSVICGMRNFNQLDTVLKAFDNFPDSELMKKALNIIDRDEC